MQQSEAQGQPTGQIVLRIDAHNSSFSHSWGYVFKSTIREVVQGSCEQEVNETILISIPFEDQNFLQGFMPISSEVETMTRLEVVFEEINNDKPYNPGFAGFVGDVTSWEINKIRKVGKITKLD